MIFVPEDRSNSSIICLLSLITSRPDCGDRHRGSIAVLAITSGRADLGNELLVRGAYQLSGGSEDVSTTRAAR
jgi:hypothetical protein